MDLLLITNDVTKTSPLVSAAEQAGWCTVGTLGVAEAIGNSVRRVQPHAIMVVADTISPQLLAQLQAITGNLPLPVVLLTQDREQKTIHAAVQAGVTSYVVDCADPGRIGALLNVACVRFEEIQKIRQELSETKNVLAERKYVEKAKGIIMRQKNMSEDNAYQSLRKLAMDRNKRLGDIAQEIIMAADILV
ncbi:MAG: ANTAR domain-containing protein [Pseudomonadota bacterium]